MLSRWIAVGALGVVTACAWGQAQEASVEAAPTEVSWRYTLEVKPMLWAPALRGDIKLPQSGSVNVEDIGADESRLAPAGQVELRGGDWFVRFRGFGFSINPDSRAGSNFDLDGEAVSRGDATESSIDYYGFDLRVGYDLWQPVKDEARNVRLAIGLYGGARLFNIESEISAGGASSSAQETWLQPVIGARLGIDLPHGFGVEVTGDLGWWPGGDESFSWDITAAFTWRWENRLGLEIGFRHLYSDLSAGSGAGEYEFDASLAGLYGALVIRF